MDLLTTSFIIGFIVGVILKIIHWIHIDKKRKGEMQAGLIEYLKPSVRSTYTIWKYKGCHADIDVPDGDFTHMKCDYCGTDYNGYSLIDLLHYNKDRLPIESRGWISVIQGLDKYEIEQLRNKYHGF